MGLLLHPTVELTSQRFASVQSHPQRSRSSSTHLVRNGWLACDRGAFNVTYLDEENG